MDGKYGCWFMWGLGTDYEKAGMLERIRSIWLWSHPSQRTEADMFSQIPGTMY